MQFIKKIQYIETNTNTIKCKDISTKKLKSLWEKAKNSIALKP